MQSQIDPELPEETSGPNIGKILVGRLRQALGFARDESSAHGTAIEGLQEAVENLSEATNTSLTALDNSIPSKVRSALLTGISFATNAAITAADSVLGALGKLQKQFTDHFADAKGHMSEAQKAIADITGVVAVTESGKNVGSDGVDYWPAKVEQDLNDNVMAILNGDGSVSQWFEGSGATEYNFDVERAVAQAIRLRTQFATPATSETIPTAKSNGNNFFIDSVTGNNSNAGNTPLVPWKDAWKLPSNPGAGATIYIAADGVYEYAETWANYKANTLFGGNTIGQWTGTQSNPINFTPYYPRGLTSTRPKISWYALMQAADWTQEIGISGGKVWSAAWAKGGNAYYNTGVAFGAERKMGVAWGQHNSGGLPAELVAAGQFAVSNSKIYVYVPDGTNPITYYGEVRIFGGNGMSPYRGYNGLTQNVKFYGIHFDLCSPFELWATNTTNNADSLEVSFCKITKCTPSSFNNSQNYASGGVESVLYFHDNFIEDSHSSTFKLQTSAGHAGNTTSWRVARNRILRGNVSTCYGGAILYNQAKGGTHHHAWGNYGYEVNNGIAREEIDGSMLYSDVNSNKSVFFGNAAERSGKMLQSNSAPGVVAVANFAIDCGSLGSFTNTAGDFKTPSAVVVHNTYLWTGRIQFSQINAGVNIGGTGVKSWEYEPVIEVTNSQANQTGNATYNFADLVVANNACVNGSGTKLSNKKAARVPASWVNNLLVRGNGVCGLATNAIGDPQNPALDYTNNSGYCSLIGGAEESESWIPNVKLGNGRPGVGSKLVGAGAELSVQYQDIGGRNFASRPTIGCYEAQI